MKRSILPSIIFLISSQGLSRPSKGKIEAILPTAYIVGWAIDKDQPAESVKLNLLIDGKIAGSTETTILRPDINDKYAASGLHGFKIPIPLRYQDGLTHKFKVTALDADRIAAATNLTLDSKLPNRKFSFAKPLFFQTEVRPDMNDQNLNMILIRNHFNHATDNRFVAMFTNMVSNTLIEEPLASLVNQEGGQMTGLFQATYQRGLTPSTANSFLQLKDREVGVWLDSNDAMNDSPIASVQIQRQFVKLIANSTSPNQTEIGSIYIDAKPWQQYNSELGMSFLIKIPKASVVGNPDKSAAHVVAYFLLFDEQTHQSFWIGANIFDLKRIGKISPIYINLDIWNGAGATGLPIVAGDLGSSQVNFHHAGPNSMVATGSVFSNYRWVDFRINYSELQNALVSLNEHIQSGKIAGKPGYQKFQNFSESPLNYRVITSNLSNEVARGSNSDRSKIGLTIEGFRITQYPY